MEKSLSIFKVIMKLSIILSIILIIIYCDEVPVKPEDKNQSPKIFSLTIFPEVVKPNDSLIVVCNAFEPDGDTLVYDWSTTGVVRIKGYNHPWLYNTKNNSQIFYAPDSQFVSSPKDTFWVQCFARDRKGNSDNLTVHFIVTNIVQ